MVIGKGMIATAFCEYLNNDNVVIFASGVSNSKEENLEPYIREESLLSSAINENIDKIIIYFSTCSINDDSVNSSFYIKHKLKMEKMIINKSNKFFIFRLPQVVGIGKSMTLINFLFYSINNNNMITINRNSTRNLIHVEDVVEIVDYLIQNNIYTNEITNIATETNLLVLDIVKKIEKIVNNKARYKLVEFGSIINIDISKIKELNYNFKIFDKDYVDYILNKYYSDKLL